MPSYTASSLDTFVSATLERALRGAVQQTIDNNALLAFLKTKGRFKTLNPPGESIRIPARYTTTSKGTWYTGMETITLQEEEILKTLAFEWKFVAFPLVLDNTKLRRNRGESAIVAYLDQVVEAAKEEAADELNLRIATSPSGADSAKQMNGFKSFVKEDGLGTHGGHTSTGTDWWSNKFKDADDTDVSAATFSFASHGLKLWNHMYWTIAGSNKRSEMCDLIITNKQQFLWMQALIQGKYTIETKNKTFSDLGVSTFDFNNAPVIWDPDWDDPTTPLGHTGFFCTKDIFVWVDGSSEMEMDPWQDYRPLQDGRASALRKMIQMGARKRANQGLTFDATSA